MPEIPGKSYFIESSANLMSWTAGEDAPQALSDSIDGVDSGEVGVAAEPVQGKPITCAAPPSNDFFSFDVSPAIGEGPPAPRSKERGLLASLDNKDPLKIEVPPVLW